MAIDTAGNAATIDITVIIVVASSCSGIATIAADSDENMERSFAVIVAEFAAVAVLSPSKAWLSLSRSIANDSFEIFSSTSCFISSSAL